MGVHPFAMEPEELKRTFSGICGERTHRRLALPGHGRAPLPSHPLLREALGTPETAALAYGDWRVPGILIPRSEELSWLLQLPAPEAFRSQGVLMADSLRFWQAAGRLAWEILSGEHFLPGIFLEQEPASGNGRAARAKAQAVWQPTLDSPAIAAKVRSLEEAMPPVCLSFAVDAESGKASTNVAALLRDFLAGVVDVAVRNAAGASPLGSSGRSPQDAWLAALAANHPRIGVNDEQAAELADALASWRARLEPVCGQGLRACLRLTEPERDGGKWTLEYLLQSSADLSLLAAARDIWTGGAVARKLAALSGAHPEERLLAALNLAGRVFAPIEATLKRSDPDRVLLDSIQAYRFLKEAAPVLSDSGFGVLLPPWWNASK